LGVGVAVVGAVCVWLGTRLWLPTPEVPFPSNLDRLEPQLRDYLVEKINWVRQRSRSGERQATLGLVYAGNGLWPEARLAFSNAVQLSPKEPLARLYVAVSAQELGELNTATQLLVELTKRFPDFAPGFYRLGDVALKQGDVSQAESAFQRLTALEPKEWRGWVGLGEVKLRNGQPAEAARLLKQSLELNPGAKSAHHLLGLAYRGMGKMDEARLELSLGLNPTSYPMPDAWSKLVPQHMKLLQDQFDIATDLEQSGEPAKAVALLEQALAYHTNHLGLLNNLAIAFNRAGEPKKGRAVARRALKLNDRYLPAWITLSYSCQAVNETDSALAAADRAVALSPGTAQTHLARANALLGAERDREALTELEEASRCDPKNAEIQMEMGDVCWRNLHMPEEALSHYVSATNLNLALTPVYLRLGDLYLQRAETNAAHITIQMLRQLDPASPDLPALEERWRHILKRQQEGKK
jgi:tetratricopeptide (TPR) repeat protein